MAFKPFEKSKKDVEVKGKGKEGSKREEAFDKLQAKGKGPVFAKGKAPVFAKGKAPVFAKGGPVKKSARGC